MQQDTAGADAVERALDRERERQAAEAAMGEPEPEAWPSGTAEVGPQRENEPGNIPAGIPEAGPEVAARTARIEELNAETAAAQEQQAAREASRERAARQEHEAEAEALRAAAWQPGHEAPSWRDAEAAMPGPGHEVEAEV
jgi:hypothetical protein